MIADEVPAALGGERLDRVVALLADVSRSTATELIADGAVHVDGAVATSGKVRLEIGARVAIETTAIRSPALPSGRTMPSSSPSSTSTRPWSSSTNPPDWSSIPAPATPTARWSTVCWRDFPTSPGVGDAGPSRHRPPPRRRELRTARRRPHGGGQRVADRPIRRAHGRTALRRPGVGSSGRCPWHRRCTDRPGSRATRRRWRWSPVDARHAPSTRSSRSSRRRPTSPAVVPTGDWSHPPDPCAPGGGRSSTRRRRRLRPGTDDVGTHPPVPPRRRA